MKCGLRWATVTLMASLAAPSGAMAGVLRAEGILPPGQSGYVSAAGLANGTGSPHLYDQQPLFIDFRRKSFGFYDAGSREDPKPGVTIVRNTFGVPSIRAGSDADVWWGAGYAVAQDRMFQLELFRRATTGRLAEIVGKGYIPDDIIARRDYYTPAEMDAMLDALPASMRTRVSAYRDGINAWVAHLRSNPQQIPGEFAATGATLTPWTVRDSVAVGIFLARTVPSGDGNELSNLRALKESGPAVMRRLLPLRFRRQVATIPRSEGRFTQGPPRSGAQERAALARSLAFAESLPVPSEGQAAAAADKRSLAPGRLGRAGGSLMFAVRAPGGRAYLFNGPQLGYSVPELFVELELHAPGFDIRGVTAAGVPVIGIGHNGRVAWGFTSGLSDEDDLYAEKLVPGQPERYEHKGEVRSMQCRDETFTYRSPPSDLLGAAPPESGSQVERICRTVHGPVQARAGGVAYARRYAIWGRELETIHGIVALNAARSVHDVDAAMRQVTWNENVIAADDAGNIGYWHPGLFQLRPREWDERLPYPGTGEAEWPGLLDRAKTPRVINPKQGWLANWNNVPSVGWTNGDGESTERVTAQYHRAAWLFRLVRRFARNPTWEGAETVILRQGSTAQQRPLLREKLRNALRGAEGSAATVLRTILEWDGSYHRTDRRGTADPGLAAWEEFKVQATKRAIDPLGKGAPRFGTRTSSSHVFDISNGTAFAMRTIGRDGIRAAAAAAFAELAKRHKTSDPGGWRTPRRMYSVGAQGAGSAPPLPFFDRGTWEQLVELGP